VSGTTSSGAPLPHKATIDSGSEQPERYYSPNPAPIIQARERERERHRGGGRDEDEVIPNSAHPGSLPHYRDTGIKRGIELGMRLQRKGLQETERGRCSDRGMERRGGQNPSV